MKAYMSIVILYLFHGQMEEIRIPMMRGNMDDIGDEEVKLKTYMYTTLYKFQFYNFLILENANNGSK